MNETREQAIDRMTQNRLERSNRYRNAANAEEQSRVEAEITAEAERDYDERYGRQG